MIVPLSALASAVSKDSAMIQLALPLASPFALGAPGPALGAS